MHTRLLDIAPASEKTALGKTRHVETVLAKLCEDQEDLKAFLAKLFQAGFWPCSVLTLRARIKIIYAHVCGQVWVTDGEPAEQLAGFLAQARPSAKVLGPFHFFFCIAEARGVLPSIKAVTRCALHSGQRSMEASLKSDPLCSFLVSEWVTKLAGPETHGSWARAVKNSCKLQALWMGEVQELSTLMPRAKSTSSSLNMASHTF